MVALAGCTTSHVDNPAVSAPPSVPFTATASVPTPTSATVDPCAILSAADIEAALGGKAIGRSEPISPGTTACAWSITASSVQGSNLIVTYEAQTRAAFQAAATTGGAVTINGIGDGAFYLPSLPSVTVLLGDHEVTVQGTLRQQRRSRRRSAPHSSPALEQPRHTSINYSHTRVINGTLLS